MCDDRRDGRPDNQNPNHNREGCGDHRHRVQFHFHGSPLSTVRGRIPGTTTRRRRSLAPQNRSLDGNQGFALHELSSRRAAADRASPERFHQKMPNLEAHRRQKTQAVMPGCGWPLSLFSGSLALSIQLVASPDPLPEDARRDPVWLPGRQSLCLKRFASCRFPRRPNY
jgi:hypothetical protein